MLQLYLQEQFYSQTILFIVVGKSGESAKCFLFPNEGVTENNSEALTLTVFCIF